MKVASAVFGSLLFTFANANGILKDIIIEDNLRLEREGYYKQDEKPDSVLNEPQMCVDNKVVIDNEVFDCAEIDFLSFLSLKDIEIEQGGHPEGFRAADIWGWVGPSGREFTLLGLDNGAAVIDSTDPLNPCVVAKMATGRVIHIWADIKVYDNTMYVVKDMRGPDPVETENYGVEVFDLLPFDQIDCHVDGYEPLNILPNYVYDGHGQCHNLVVNPESGLLYSVGTEVCEGGFMMLDVKTDRLKPELLMCADGDGYTHDGQCVIYDGPDPDHQGKEICFAFNEDTLTIWDFSDISNPTILSRLPYINQAYSHQGWVNNDLTKVLLDDELDELCNSDDPHPACPDLVMGELTGLTVTSTNVFDIVDLDNPFLEGVYVHKDLSIDHNLYIWGLNHRKGWGGSPPMEYYPDPNYAYLNNYLAGLRVLDIRSDNVEEWFEAGYFDIAPERTELAFAGAWSGYLHPSGVYAISSIERGLFLLSPRMAFTDEFPQAPADPPAPSPGTDLDLNTLILLLIVVIGILLVTILLFLSTERRVKKTVNAQSIAQSSEVKGTVNPVYE